jgi:hypothetical protein
LCTASAVLFAAAAAQLGVAQERGPLPAELAWVALFSEELLVWLEDENRLDELCAGEPYPVSWHGCRAEQLEPKVALLPLRSEPRLDAGRQGELVVVALPGRGLRAFVSRTGIAQRFTPDLYDGDWGYGPYFHQTILARQGSWFRIPLPVVEAAWINVEEWGESGLGAVPPLESVVPGQILTTPAGDMVVGRWPRACCEPAASRQPTCGAARAIRRRCCRGRRSASRSRSCSLRGVTCW